MVGFARRSSLPVPVAELFAWHRRPGAFERLAPSWERLEIVARSGTIEDGDRLHFRVRKGPLAVDWVARHEDYVEGEQFVDVAERSPFAAWRHVHRFTAGPEPGWATLHDEVDLRLPLHTLAWPLAGRVVEAMLERMFRQRHLRTAIDLRRHQRVCGAGARPRRVAVDGTGTFADQLRAFWTTGGHVLDHAAPEIAVQLGSRPTEVLASWRPQVLVLVAHDAERLARRPQIEALARLGTRVVALRTRAIVGLGGRPVAEGEGFIDLDDLIGLVHHVVFDARFEGPVEACVSEGLRERGVEFDFGELDESLAHWRGRERPQQLEAALARFRAQAEARSDGAPEPRARPPLTSEARGQPR